MNTLDENNCLLLLIDVQEKLVAMLEKNTVVRKSNTLLQTANILGIPTIITEQYPQGLGKTVDFVAEHIKDSTLVFEKTAFSAFLTELPKNVVYFSCKPNVFSQTGRRSINS